MPASLNHGGHSAKVNMQLLVNGTSLRVEQMAEDFVLVNTPFDHPPSDARLVLQVDENESCWDVRLPEGISAASRRIAIGAAETVASGESPPNSHTSAHDM